MLIYIISFFVGLLLSLSAATVNPQHAPPITVGGTLLVLALLALAAIYNRRRKTMRALSIPLWMEIEGPYRAKRWR